MPGSQFNQGHSLQFVSWVALSGAPLGTSLLGDTRECDDPEWTETVGATTDVTDGSYDLVRTDTCGSVVSTDRLRWNGSVYAVTTGSAAATTSGKVPSAAPTDDEIAAVLDIPVRRWQEFGSSAGLVLDDEAAGDAWLLVFGEPSGEDFDVRWKVRWSLTAPDGTTRERGEIDQVDAGNDLTAHPAAYAPHRVGVWLVTSDSQRLYGEKGDLLATVPAGRTVVFGAKAGPEPGFYELKVDGTAWTVDQGAYKAP